MRLDQRLIDFAARQKGKILHLGCGRKRIPGTVGIDVRKDFPEVDQVADLNKPLDFKESSVDAVLSAHLLEHLDYQPFMNEMLRILKPGGQMLAIIPHYSNHRAHIGWHRQHGFAWIGFEHFRDPSHPFYGFKVVSNKISFGHKLSILSKIVNSSEKIKYAWERFFSFILPAVECEVVLEKREDSKRDLEVSE